MTDLFSRRSKLPLQRFMPPKELCVFILQRVEAGSQLLHQPVCIGIVHRLVGAMSAAEGGVGSRTQPDLHAVAKGFTVSGSPVRTTFDVVFSVDGRR